MENEFAKLFLALGILFAITSLIFIVLVAMIGRTLDDIRDVLKDIRFYLKK